MSDETASQVPSVFSSKERAALVARALSDAARRARFSTKGRRGTATTYRARRSERIARLLQIMTFVVFVVLPGAAASIYFGLIASNRYTAEARFTVRGGLPGGLAEAGALANAPGMLIAQDTQVIMSYIKSRALVEHLIKSVGLLGIYEDPNADYFSRLKPHRPIEKIIKYWNKQVELQVQMPGGIVILTVQAFKPDDAVTIANAVLASSESLVNDMNDQMRDDALGLAKKERERAQEGLAKARAELEKARNEEGMLSASESSSAMLDLETQVRGQLIKLQQDYESMSRFVRPDSVQLRGLQTKIDAAKQQVAKLQAQMTSAKSQGNPLSGSMSKLDYAQLNSDIADKIYAGALTALEQATLATQIKLMYINTFVTPVAAEEAKYPRRGLDIAIVIGAGLVLWTISLGFISLLRRGMV